MATDHTPGPRAGLGPWPLREKSAPAGREAVSFEVSDHVSRFANSETAIRALAAALTEATDEVLKLAASVCPGCL
ncbi:MAG: hypothetical protein ACI9HI_001519, partial [Salinirussus sp.]